MTTATDIVNRALQIIGTRTTVTDAELANETTNEAIQANLILTQYRDQLLRMAPWDCALVYANLAYITSVPGTPENTSPATTLWTPGQPAPPWAYEYLYPADCLRACFIIPANQTGFSGSVPITTAVTGGAPAFWNGQPVKFKVALDKYFREALTVGLAVGGSGFRVGDTVLLGGIPSVSGEVPAGLVNVQVATVNNGVATSITLADLPNIKQNSFLYAVPTYTLEQVSSSGLGTGMQVVVTSVGATAFPARTILTNQEFATMAYCQQVTDPNVMDPMFQEAWAAVIGGGLAIALTGDKGLANLAIGLANKKIEEARKADGNEGLTINDVTPDWIRVRGVDSPGMYAGPWSGFDWGASWPTY